MSIERELLKRFMIELTTEADVVSLFNDIKDCLAQPEQTEQEPVAWMWDEMFCEDWTTVSSVIKPSKSKYVDNVRPLYLAPPKQEPLSKDYISSYYEDLRKHKEECEADFKEQQSEEKWYANSLGDSDE